MWKKRLKKLQLKPKFVWVFVLTASNFMTSPELLSAQSDKKTNSHTQDIEISFKPSQLEPPDRGTPKSDEGTGSRGDCLHKPSSPPLQSLVGKHNLKLTTSTRPTFWVYIPYTQTEAAYGEFSLQHRDDEIYRTRFRLPTQPGIIGVSLPPQVASLNIGQQYRWYVDIDCAASNSDDLSTPASLTGIVERVVFPANFAHQSKTASQSLDRVAIYAKNGIWYDAITELAQLRLQQPDNPIFKQAWYKLLSDRDVNLAEISSEPILESVEIIK